MNDSGADAAPIYQSGDISNTGVLDVGETWTYKAVHTVNQSDIDNGQFLNMATGSGLADTLGTGSGNTPVSDHDTALVYADIQPALKLVKTITSGNPYNMQGDTVHYQYTVYNVGNVTLNGPISITDNKIPVINPAPGFLAPNDSVEITAVYIITLNDISIGSVENIAFATDKSSGIVSEPDTAIANITPFGCQYWITCEKEVCLTGIPLIDTVAAGIIPGTGNCPGDNSGVWTNPVYPGSTPILFSDQYSDTTTFEITTPGSYTFRYTWPNGTIGSITNKYYEPTKPIIVGDTAVTTCSETTYLALDGRTNTYGDVSYKWHLLNGGAIIGSDSSDKVTIQWNNIKGTDTLIVNSSICSPCQCLIDCSGVDTIVVNRLLPKFAGQIKYWNQYETFMPSPFATDVNNTIPSDYFYVTLYHVDGNQYDSLETVKVEMHTIQGVKELLSYFEFNTNTYSYGCDAKFVLKVWDGGVVYQSNPLPPEDETYLENSYTYRNWGGVNATDALAIQLMAAHEDISGIPWNYSWIGPYSSTPEYGYYSHAIADVNSSNTYGSGSITALDALTAKYRSVGLIGNYPDNGSNNQFSPNFRVTGRFVDSLPEKTFPKPFEYHNTDDIPFVHSGNDYLYFSKATAHKYSSAPITFDNTKNYINIYYEAIGDVNAGYVPPGSGLKVQPTAELAYEGVVSGSIGDTVLVPISIDRHAEIGAITLNFTYRNDLINVLGTNFGEDGEFIDHEKGILHMGWFDMDGEYFGEGDDIAVIKVVITGKIMKDTRLFSLEPSSELAHPNAQPFFVKLKAVSVTTEKTILGGNDIYIINYPNPFETKTTFKYILPEAGKVKLDVYDLNGKYITTVVDDKYQKAGTHYVKFRRTPNMLDAMYIYHLNLSGEFKNYAVVKKFEIIMYH
jgi:hypothetical protein